MREDRDEDGIGSYPSPLRSTFLLGLQCEGLPVPPDPGPEDVWGPGRGLSDQTPLTYYRGRELRGRGRRRRDRGQPSRIDL